MPSRHAALEDAVLVQNTFGFADCRHASEPLACGRKATATRPTSLESYPVIQEQNHRHASFELHIT